ncbi:MAG TPA: peptidase S1, partial [Dehalococcoidia bacterium]|nr:peptidase S1 [Dehalococcoidia bacterium]
MGQEVIAIGHALGLPGGPKVSKGVISALGRSIAVDAQTTMVDFIQNDASINP